MKATLNRFLRECSDLLGALYDPEKESKYPWLSFLWLGGIFLAGIYLFGVFFNWGNFSVDFHDWAEISAARLAFLQDAVLKGVLPLHMPDSSALRGVTDRFMSIPDMILSPQIQLMRFMDVKTFVFINTLLLYTAGCFGLLKLRKKFSLSLIVMAVVFFLFNFNGHILSHLSVGHATWGGYFLFPWFALLIFRLLEGDHSWGWVALTSGLLFTIFLQGSFHHFIWTLFVLGLLGLSNWRLFSPVFKALVFSLLLSMVRILPPALEMAKFDTEYLGGYPTLFHLGKALVTIVPPEQSLTGRFPLTVLGWWEFDLHIGLAGTALLLIFGVFLWLRNRHHANGYGELLFPLGLLTVLTIGNIYRLAAQLHIPLIAGERVSSRMIILPFVFIVILGAIQAQNWLRKRPESLAVSLGGVGIIMVLMHDLWQYIRLWRIEYAKDFFPVTPVNMAIKVVANHADPPYLTAFIAGLVITTVTLLCLGYLSWRETRHKAGHPAA